MGELRDAIERLIPELDPQVSPTSEQWVCAAVLLASLSLGAVEEEIEQELEVVPEFLAAVSGRLRAGGIWDGVTVATAETYDDPETGGTAFWMDVAVAVGDIERSPDATYRMTNAGRKRVEKMLA